MKKVAQILADMKTNHLFNDYAIGGAMAAIYYIEPFQTEDIDVMFRPLDTEQNTLLSMSTIYEFLGRKGFTFEREMILIQGYPVQFIPVYSPLVDEAVGDANTIALNGETIRVMTPEHLVAIMLATGRAKDYLRISLFLDANAVSLSRLMEILERHNLHQKWNDNQYRFKQ